MSKKAAGIVIACIAIVIVVVVVVVPRLSPAPQPIYGLTITSTDGGSVSNPGEDSYEYEAGAVVDLEAVPEEGYVFVNWTGDVDAIEDVNAPSTTITMEGDYTVTANFEEIPAVEYTLTITSGEGGSVTTPVEGAFTYEEGTVVDLVAMAAGGYEFVNWTGDVDTVADVNAASTTITMNGDYSVKANFVQVQLLKTWYDLHAIRGDLSGNYRLANDLHSGTAGYAELAGTGANDGQGWQPIGNWEDRFTGSFDGQGYSISGMFIDRPEQIFVALFGYVGSGGVIANVDLTHTGVTGYEAVGGLVGSNEGTVVNCAAMGSVEGRNYVGGLMGINSGEVHNSHSNGSARNTMNFRLGGLVGWNTGTVSNCSSLVSVTGYNLIGGLVGNNAGTITNSFSAGSVTGIGQYLEGYPSVGGLVGVNEEDGVVSNSFWDVENSGMDESHGGTGKTTAELSDILTFTDTATEGLDSPWDIAAVDGFDQRDTDFVWNIVDGVAWPFHSWRIVLI